MTDGPWLNTDEKQLRWKANNDYAWEGMADQRAYLQAALRLLDEARGQIKSTDRESSHVFRGSPDHDGCIDGTRGGGMCLEPIEHSIHRRSQTKSTDHPTILDSDSAIDTQQLIALHADQAALYPGGTSWMLCRLARKLEAARAQLRAYEAIKEQWTGTV